MKVVDDFNASVPSNFSQSLNRVIPASPSNITLAAFGLAVTKINSDVLLDSTVEFQSTLGTPEILMRIFRGTTIIGTARVETLAVNEIRNANFQIIDRNPPIGYHSYRITAEVLNPALNEASAVGPITFSGTNFAPVS